MAKITVYLQRTIDEEVTIDTEDYTEDNTLQEIVDLVENIKDNPNGFLVDFSEETSWIKDENVSKLEVKIKE